MWGSIANEIGGWLLAAFGIRKGLEREREKKRRKSQKVSYTRRHRR
jgi:hypothetical protein